MYCYTHKENIVNFAILPNKLNNFPIVRYILQVNIMTIDWRNNIFVYILQCKCWMWERGFGIYFTWYSRSLCWLGMGQWHFQSLQWYHWYHKEWYSGRPISLQLGQNDHMLVNQGHPTRIPGKYLLYSSNSFFLAGSRNWVNSKS